MSSQQSKYTVSQVSISNVLSWIEQAQIAIPEIQRPFVWKATQVRDLMDSLLQGYPVGYLITWNNPDTRLKDGSLSAGKSILIDGQQRVTALMAALKGHEVVTKDYRRVRIKIAFHPVEQRFEVSNSIILKDPTWIQDISALFTGETDLIALHTDYCARNPQVDVRKASQTLQMLYSINNNQIGMIKLEHWLPIETVTEIFIRVNSKGVSLSQADFAMSKIAVNEDYQGIELRKAIDYFCHLSVAPAVYSTLEKNDRAFAQTDYWKQMQWLRAETSSLYDPSYVDMLRVAFTSQFKRGKLQDLVALLSGRNFVTRQYEEEIVEDTFNRLKQGVLHFINQTNFQNLLMIIKSAGFIDASLIRSQNVINMAYAIYLTLRDKALNRSDIEYQVRRWFVLSMLTGRYSGSAETAFDLDMRQIDEQGIDAYAEQIIRGSLSDAFWETTLPQHLNTSASASPYLFIFQAAQVKQGDKGFFSQDITVQSLIEHKSDLHHIFPRDYLKKQGITSDQYNQIANYAIAQSDINISISNKAPNVYFREMFAQAQGAKKYYGNIVSLDELRANLDMHCIPDGVEDMTAVDYPSFLAERRCLMALKIKEYFFSL